MMIKKNLKHWLLLDDNSEHKKSKDGNRNVVATLSPNQLKDVLLNNKCLRHSINSIQTKDNGIESYEIKKNFIVFLWWQNIYSK